jgi:hypothetical protein
MSSGEGESRQGIIDAVMHSMPIPPCVYDTHALKRIPGSFYGDVA